MSIEPTPEPWRAHMTKAEAERWHYLRSRAAELDAERRDVTDETNRLRQRVMQRALYRQRSGSQGRAA